MQVFKDIPSLRLARKALDGVVGFVPTMGALHEGHASLMQRAVEECDHVIASVFVNPTQFGPNEDLGKYPRTLDSDLDLCRDLGVAGVFTPSERTLYPEGFSTYIKVEGLSDRLCGASRPGHFRGVTTVVAKFLNLVRPTKAFFGQKDAQQCVILKRMAQDLNLGSEIVVCPTVREKDGLALSSRNRYLNDEQRTRALALSRGLFQVEDLFSEGERDPITLVKTILGELEEHTDRVDYVSIVDYEDLSDIATIDRPALCAVAAFISETRLIDNVILDPESA